MSMEFFNYRISEASERTLGTLDFITDIKNERGITSQEALALVSRMRTVEKIRSDAGREGEMNLAELSPVFIEEFAQRAPQIVRSCVAIELLELSTESNWSFLNAPVVEPSHKGWFAIDWISYSTYQPLCCSVEPTFSCEKSLAVFSRELVSRGLSLSDWKGALRDPAARSVFEKELQTLAALFTFNLRIDGNLIAELPLSKLAEELLPYVACSPSKQDVAHLLKERELPSAIKHSEAYAHLFSETVEDELTIIEHESELLMKSFVLSHGLILDVWGFDLYKRFKNEMVEKTLLAERRVAMSIMDRVAASGGSREYVSEIISEQIARFKELEAREWERIDRLSFLSSRGDTVSSGSRIEHNWSEVAQYAQYATLILLKNRRFLLDFYSR